MSAFIKIPEPVLLDHEYDIPSVSVASETVYESSSQRKSSAPASTVGWGVIVNLKVS